VALSKELGKISSKLSMPKHRRNESSPKRPEVQEYVFESRS